MKKTYLVIKVGLIRDPKHRIAMAECFWLFAYMIDVCNWETGTILEWKDESVAEDMEIPIRTLRDQRRKLEAGGYITCTQEKHSQSITIMNWTNPREYSGNVYNPKIKGDTPPSPSKIKGDTKGDTKGSSQSVTPTLDSKVKESNGGTFAELFTEVSK